MTIKDLELAVADATKLSKKDVEEVVKATLSAIQNALKNKEEVRLLGLGTFTVKHKDASTKKNPFKGGEEVVIPAKDVVKFKPSKTIFD